MFFFLNKAENELPIAIKGNIILAKRPCGSVPRSCHTTCIFRSDGGEIAKFRKTNSFLSPSLPDRMRDHVNVNNDI